MVVKAEYDGIADWPDNWINVLAVANAVLGALQLHVSSAFYDSPWCRRSTSRRRRTAKAARPRQFLIPTPSAETAGRRGRFAGNHRLPQPGHQTDHRFRLLEILVQGRSSGWPLPPPDGPAPSGEAVQNRESDGDGNAAGDNFEDAAAGDDAAAVGPEENESLAPALDEAMADDGAEPAEPSSSTSHDAPDAAGAAESAPRSISRATA
ncbi:PE-PPE domain-containing protein [Mycolicibacterium austroafricanum]|uniref:PE-PPE domain-containing protein n=1 Tax=Mycolicibacterium austroafricanum TaxID=39687 RepID=UPI001F2D803A